MAADSFLLTLKLEVHGYLLTCKADTEMANVYNNFTSVQQNNIFFMSTCFSSCSSCRRRTASRVKAFDAVKAVNAVILLGVDCVHLDGDCGRRGVFSVAAWSTARWGRVIVLNSMTRSGHSVIG